MIVSAERQHRFSFEEYLAIADQSENRVEFWEGAILDMSGGSPRHSAIAANILGLLRNLLRGAPCRPYDSNLRVRSLPANRATYADVTVVCGPLELDPADKTRQTVLNPAVVIEVLSPSTQGDDRGPKLDTYKLIASVANVILVAQDRREIVVHERRPDGAWSIATYVEGSAVLEAIACELPLAEVYDDLPDV